MHKYHYVDSLSDAQDMEWVLTTDKLGRVEKEYYPYAIAMAGSDEYHSVLYDYDRANRRKYLYPRYRKQVPDTPSAIQSCNPLII